MRRHLLSSRNDVPILMLSAHGSTEDRINGQHTGADDYLPKPFGFDERIARIEALHRRNTRSTTAEVDRTLRVGPLTFDPASMWLMLDGAEPDLSAKERDVPVLLMRTRAGSAHGKGC